MFAAIPAIVVQLAVLVLAIVWLLLPFGIFGIKPRLERQAAELERIRAALERLSPVQAEEAESRPALPDHPCWDCGATVPRGSDTCPECMATQLQEAAR